MISRGLVLLGVGGGGGSGAAADLYQASLKLNYNFSIR